MYERMSECKKCMYECMNVWMYKRMSFNECMNLLGMMNNYWKNTIKYRIRLLAY